MTLSLDIQEVVRFYDDDSAATPHSNAVKTLAGEELGLALLEHYLGEAGRFPKRVDAPCTTDGAWLDGWIKVKLPAPVYFQVEVKSWSMHSYASRKHQLPIDASAVVLSKYKADTWNHYWHEGTFKAKGLKKALRRMRLPKNEYGIIEPVACIWAAVHPTGAEDPFFTVQTVEAEFPSVHVFSMSAYLRRSLRRGTTMLSLSLPKTEQRIAYLGRLFPPTI